VLPGRVQRLERGDVVPDLGRQRPGGKGLMDEPWHARLLREGRYELPAAGPIEHPREQLAEATHGPWSVPLSPGARARRRPGSARADP
jgi:hypothetical protein